ncbi:MAG: serine/threonine-protein kinase [Myxococcota bacterium]|nr:serine/threonine-protein kinase [Myxococcota bacterium]
MSTKDKRSQREALARLAQLGLEVESSMGLSSGGENTYTLDGPTVERARAQHRGPLPELVGLSLGPPLGRGGMGEVLLGVQQSLAREVAVKRPLKQSGVKALRQEALIAAELEHPSVIPVYDLGADSRGMPLLVMRRVQGRTWGDDLRQRDEIGLAWAELRDSLYILGRISQVLALAHDRGILHRDVKPDNVLLGDYGEVWLMDWGLATRLPAPASDGPVGTPAYMPPELAHANHLAQRAATDVYMLGACLYEILGGRPPHMGNGTALRNARVGEVNPLPRGVPKELEELCMSALHTDPYRRPEDGGAFYRALMEATNAVRVKTVLHEAEQRHEKFQRLSTDPQATDLEVHQLFGACRFGYQAVLEDDPENVAARHKHDAAVATMVRYELARGRIPSARASAMLLIQPDPALGEELRRLARQLGERTSITPQEPEPLVDPVPSEDTLPQPPSRLPLVVTAVLAVAGWAAALGILLLR